MTVMPEGPSVTKNCESQSILSTGDNDCISASRCFGCRNDNIVMFRCKRCHTQSYCSKKCQKNCWSDHKIWCDHIVELESRLKSKAFADVNFLSKSSGLSPRDEIKLVKLVGRKCTVDCVLDEVHNKVLWDTGAEVALVSRSWLNKHYPRKEIKDVSELLGHNLYLKVANNTLLDFVGYTEIVFKLSDNAEPLLVPFLVTEEEMSMPLIGYNVIEEVCKGSEDESKRAGVIEMVESSFDSVDHKKAEALVNLIEKKVTSDQPENLSDVYLGGKDVVVPKGKNLKLKCVCRVPVSENLVAMFQPNLQLDLTSGLVVGEGIVVVERGKTKLVVPVSNPTGSDIILRARTQIGVVVPVSSVLPCPVEVNSVCVEEQQNKPATIPDEEVESEDEDVIEAESENIDDEEWLQKIDLKHLTVGQQEKVKAMLREMGDAFAKDKSDIGEIENLQMRINLKNEEPVKRSYTSIPKPLYKEVQKYVEDLVASGWVRKSYSSYSSPIVCVRKKDGTLRLCIDYRQLNSKTIPDSQPIPKVQDILNSLGGNCWFSTLDMAKAYHQGFIHEDSRHLTAFATPWSLLEWVRIPFGLMNAPPIFQRYMNECLAGLLNVICIPYLDDVLTYSKSFKGHLRHCKMVLRRLIEHGVKLNPEKCVFFQDEVKYLGHVVSAEGYKVDSVSDEVVDKLKESPQTVGDLRSLLGFVGYYRSFIRDFSKKAKPLYDLLCKDKSGNVEVGKKKGKKKNVQRASSDIIDWRPEHQEIVNSLLELLKNPPVMAYPDFSLPFVLHCDASELGLGAVLYQERDGKLRVVGYASRTLTPAEKNYYLHSGKLEFLALKWAVTERFHDFLYYASSFTIYSDCNPLSYILSSTKLNATTIRWVGDLANYNFTVKYRPGKDSIDCDYLSRHPVEVDELVDKCTEEITPEVISAALVGSREKGKFAAVNLINSVVAANLEEGTISKISPAEVKMSQKNDPTVGKVLRFVETGVYPSKKEKKLLDRSTKTLLNQWKCLYVNSDGVLMRRTKHRTQLVLPEVYKPLVYEELHEKMGHLSAERVVQLSQERFYWPHLAQDIQHYVQNVCQCLKRRKPNREQRAPLVNIHSSEPFELVSVDFLKLDKAAGGYEYLLVLIDHFTRFVQVYPTRNTKGRTAGDKIFNEFIMRFGFPQKLHHDQGSEFENDLFKRLHELSGIQASRTTPYHPQGDGQVERWNRTVINMLKTLPEKLKSKWKDHVHKLVFAYNCTKNDATSFSPFQLLFGRSPRLPIDFMFDLHQNHDDLSHSDYVDSWKKAMNEACVIARNNAKKSAGSGKRSYDKKLYGATLRVGDRVLVRNKSERGGTGKLRSYWEENVHVVVEKKDDRIPVYVVKAENGTGKERTLHRNLLLPCDHLPLELPDEPPKVKVSREKNNACMPTSSQEPSVSKGKNLLKSCESGKVTISEKKRKLRPVARKSVSVSKTPVSAKSSRTECASDSTSDDEEELREKACRYLLAKSLANEFESNHNSNGGTDCRPQAVSVRDASRTNELELESDVDSAVVGEFDPETVALTQDGKLDLDYIDNVEHDTGFGGGGVFLDLENGDNLIPNLELMSEFLNDQAEPVTIDGTVVFTTSDDENSELIAGAGAGVVEEFEPNAESTLVADGSDVFMDALESFETSELQQSIANSQTQQGEISSSRNLTLPQPESSIASTVEYDISDTGAWNLVPDSSVQSELENESMDTSQENRRERGKRQRKKPQHLTYDRLGNPSVRRRSLRDNISYEYLFK